MDETPHDGPTDMTPDEKRRDQLLSAPGAVESDADPRIEVSEHDGNTRIDIAEGAAVRPGNPFEEPDDDGSLEGPADDGASEGPDDDGSLEGPDVETSTADAAPKGERGATASEGTEKPGGLGQDGTIPADPSGVAAGHTGEVSTFEPEEDEAAPA
jgi:hypothetical protein